MNTDWETVADIFELFEVEAEAAIFLEARNKPQAS
jgi:hypothetical protein